LNGDDDVLAQPTRRRLFALLSRLGGSASTDELAEQLDLHPNGVRTHLQRLRDAGLLIHRRASRPRGRPRDEWAIAADARPGGDPPNAYAALARWLARAIPASPIRLREVEATGREIGKDLAANAVGPPERAIVDMLAALGFQPEIASHAQGALSCRLGNCPYRESVRENQDVVCALHRGLTRGLLDQIAPSARLVSFVPHDPDKAGCEVEIDGLVAA
jgi:predicted ArsR family transcriptional regulator